MPALRRVCSGLHHCSSCLLSLTVHGWHWWPHSWPPLLRHARRTGGHAAHISRKWSVLHPRRWHSSQGHSTTGLAWPLSMDLVVGIDAHAGPWATVACTGHPTIRWGSGVVTLWSILAHLWTVSSTGVTLLKATDSRMHLASRRRMRRHGWCCLLRSILRHLRVSLCACHKTSFLWHW